MGQRFCRFYLDRKKAYLKHIGKKRFTKKVREEFRKSAENLIKALNRDYYIVTLYDEEEDVIDSLEGLGMEFCDEKKVYEFAKENFGIDDKEIIINFADYKEVIYKAS